MMEGSVYCDCGHCLRLDEDLFDKVKASFKTLIAPYYVLRMRTSTRKKHGEHFWQLETSLFFDPG